MSLEQHPDNTQPWQLADQKVNSGRLQFLLVSKLFQRLARLYLYYYPVLADKFPSFSRTLDMQPTLGRRIRELDIRQSAKGPSYRQMFYTSLSTPLSLASILPHTCHLTRLVGDFSSIPWRTFTTLAKIAGSTITEFAGVTITEVIGVALESPLLTHSPMIFSSFSAMRAFTWKYESHLFTFRSRDDSLFDPLDEAAVVALPALEFLSMKSPEALSLFSEMRLPSLRRASFELLGHRDTTLLKAHGAKLQHLQVERATIANTLSDGFKHAFLSKLIVNKAKQLSFSPAGVDESEWEKFFLTMDVSHLPALREVCIPSLKRPTTEREIANNVWVEAAEILLARGIKLTDETGTGWRPRLKASRGKGR
ncbi:hypothetical protein DFH09DRAFT_1365606 [Mycena vulgaris]|nr:hypothetical protein DFH09DRAFT_1365606 [Mycena vulgaris]